MSIRIGVLLILGMAISLHAYGKNTTYPNAEISEIAADLTPENTWVFIMAGQSNMAGRGKIEAGDTLRNNRILTINKKGELIVAQEPLHFYEPRMAGLDCGMSFGTYLTRHIPDSITILLIPTAVGGSKIDQWIKDKTHRGVPLLTNFTEKVRLAEGYGEIKAILWHQGESDASPAGIACRKEKLDTLFTLFRHITANEQLPILIAELGDYSKQKEYWKQLNAQAELYSRTDAYSSIISTAHFKDRGDALHFNSDGQRKLGKRFAKTYLKRFARY